MATITVTTSVDEQDGSIFDGDVSLRDALAVAASGDIIEFAAGFFSDTDPLSNSTIQLSLGQLTVSSDITINGDTNGDGIADVTLDALGSGRIFEVTGAGTDFTLNGLTLKDGAVGGSGGALLIGSASSATVSNSNFVGSYAGDDGGAIANNGALTIVNSYFANNIAIAGGGAISTVDATIVNSTFTQNASLVGGGGAVFVAEDETLTLVNSTVTGNFAESGAGGIDADTLDISNSIVFGNRDDSGGSDDLQAGTLNSNGANIFGSDTAGSGGDQSLSTFELANVFEDVGAVTLSGTTFDAGLVSRSGGITPTIGLAQGGLAVDAGDNGDVPSEADLGFDVDADGTVETGVLERDASGLNRVVGGTVDIGASENFDKTWVVDTTSDIDDGDLTTGNLSLREAIKNAADGDVITFDSTVFTADDDERNNTTIALTQGQMVVTSDIEITINGDVNGDGIADVTLDGAANNNQRMIFGYSTSQLNIESMTFANGQTSGQSGAAIATFGGLTVLNSTFIDNYSGRYGGALRLYSGSSNTIANSTFDGNTADRGGAIRNSGYTTVVNATLYGNHASTGSFGGGALESSSGALYVQNATITGNTAEGTGGGINHTGGSLQVENSIVVGNAEARNGAGNYSDDVTSTSGTASSNGGNVFGVSGVTGAGDLIFATASEVFEDTTSITVGGISATAGILANNGGPTDTVMISQDGNAVDQGDSGDLYSEANIGLDVDGDGIVSFSAVAIDQRGGPRDVGDAVDAGAVELDNSLIVVTTLEDTSDGDTSADDISWREAVELVLEGGTITFDEALFDVDDDPLSNTVISVVNDGISNIDKGFRIDGDLNDDGIADVTFDGTSSGDEMLQADSGAGLLTLEGLTIQNFSDTSGSGESGGVLRTSSPVFVLNSNFIDNYSGNFGGALRLYNGAQSVIANSYFGGNSSSQRGGAIRANDELVVVGSTFVGNYTVNIARDGGAIETFGATTLINSTLTGNYATGNGGGVNTTGSLTLLNSIIAGNAAGGAGDDVNGTFSSNGANIFNTGQTGTSAGDVVLSGSPNLGDVFDQTVMVTPGGASAFEAGLVGNNSGSGPTVSLDATDSNNPAMDAAETAALDESVLGIDLNQDGDTNDVVAFDGRGFSRYVNLPGIGSETADIGAFEIQNIATEGSDYLIGNGSANTINALGGGDYIDAGGGADSIIAGDGDDEVYDGSGADSVDLGAGNDYVRVGGGEDAYDGGAGNDYISYYDSTGGIIANLAADTISGSWAVNDTIANFESIAGSRDGDDSIIGTSGANTIRTYGGDDRVAAGNGADRVELGAGDDYVRVGGGVESFDGGSGKDYISYYDSTGGITANLEEDTISGSWAVNDTIGDFESISGSNTGGDSIIGTSGSNTIRTYGGNDRVAAGKGTDKVELGSGDDYVRVGGGAESFDGGTGKDYISYYDSTNGITVNLEEDTISGSWAVNDTIKNFESVSGSNTGDDSVVGTSGSNTINTFGGNDRVAAGAGTDRIDLGSGNDYVRVGGGAETFEGGSGTDYISYYDSSNGIRIDLRDDEVSGSWAVNDVISDFEGASGSNTGDDVMLGTNGANSLRGFGGDDSLYGRGGGDRLYGGNGEDFLDGGGGSGTDQLYGGDDADVFHFDSGEGIDIVKDFENNIDTIELDNFGLTKAQALAIADQVGSDVVFDFGSDGMLTIENATIGQLGNDLEVV